MATIILKGVRLSFPDLHQRGKAPDNAAPGTLGKYGAQFIYDAGSENDNIAKKAFIEAAQAEFGANWQAIVGAMEKSKKCIRKGNENLTRDGVIRDGYKDKLYIVARNKTQPLLIGPSRTKPKGFNDENHSDGFPILREASGLPYGGCYVNVKIDIKAMKAKEKIPNQIYASLLTVQYAAKGEAFGAAPGTAEGFDDDGSGAVEGGAPWGGGDAPSASQPAGDDLF